MRVPGFGEALRVASESGSSWVWVLASGVIPELAALERLLEELERKHSRPTPVLLASKVLTVDGKLHPASTPVPETFRPARVLAALDQRLVALRAARNGSLLVHRRSLEQIGVTTTRAVVARELEWTARLLKDAPGMLVPTSTAVRGDGERQRRPPLLSAARLIVRLDRRERLWFAYYLASQADLPNPSRMARSTAAALRRLRFFAR